MYLTENDLSVTETNQFVLCGECGDFTVNHLTPNGHYMGRTAS